MRAGRARRGEGRPEVAGDRDRLIAGPGILPSFMRWPSPRFIAAVTDLSDVRAGGKMASALERSRMRNSYFARHRLHRGDGPMQEIKR